MRARTQIYKTGNVVNSIKNLRCHFPMIFFCLAIRTHSLIQCLFTIHCVVGTRQRPQCYLMVLGDEVQKGKKNKQQTNTTK
jgi:hypothetical protein